MITMCDFKEKYGDEFAGACEFLKKHYGTHTDEDWEAVSDEMGYYSRSALSVVLIVPALMEMEHIHLIVENDNCREVATKIMQQKKAQRFQIVENYYRPILVRVYNFSRYCYRASPNNPNHAEELRFIEDTLKHAQTLSKFECELFERCYKLFAEGRLNVPIINIDEDVA